MGPAPCFASVGAWRDGLDIEILLYWHFHLNSQASCIVAPWTRIEYPFLPCGSGPQGDAYASARWVFGRQNRLALRRGGGYRRWHCIKRDSHHARTTPHALAGIGGGFRFCRAN